MAMPTIGGFDSFGFILLAAAVWVLWSTVKIVPQGYNYTVENLGRYTRTLTPGMHILITILEHVTHKLNTKEQVTDIRSQDVTTRDNARVRSMASPSTKSSTLPSRLTMWTISSIRSST
jgi:regulator of protease activity HflC (stomatin/prohibitin superfamily)